MVNDTKAMMIKSPFSLISRLVDFNDSLPNFTPVIRTKIKTNRT